MSTAEEVKVDTDPTVTHPTAVDGPGVPLALGHPQHPPHPALEPEDQEEDHGDVKKDDQASGSRRFFPR